MAGFRVFVTVKGPSGRPESKAIRFSSGENLLEAIRREFSDMKFLLDEKYGVEVSEIAGIRKSKSAGVHFTIDGQVPWAMDPHTGKKLYLSLYHITATRERMANAHIVLELVSVSCDFAGSVLDARLDFRTGEFELEELPSLGNKTARYRSFQNLPSFLPQLAQNDSSGYLRYWLAQNARNFDAARRRGMGPGFSLELRQAESQYGQPAIQQPAAPAISSENSASLPMQEVLSEGPLLLLQDGPLIFPEAEDAHLGERISKNSKSALPAMAAGMHIAKEEQSKGSAVPPAQHSRGQSNEPPPLVRIPKPAMNFSPKLPLLQHKANGRVLFSSLTRFRAAIFDLDGVMVDSEQAHLGTFNAAFAKFGVRISPSFWRRNYTGIGSRAIVQDLFRRHGIDMPVEGMVQKRAEIYRQHIERHGLPEMVGLKEFVGLLNGNGVRIAVASGGHRQHIAASLRSIGLRGIKFVGHEDVQNHKPAPDTFLLAAKRLGAKPSECIVFEDSLAGVAAAAAAGMPCIALSTTLPKKALEGKAALIVPNFRSQKLRSLMLRLVEKKPDNRKKDGALLVGVRKGEKRKAPSLRQQKRRRGADPPSPSKGRGKKAAMLRLRKGRKRAAASRIIKRR